MVEPVAKLVGEEQKHGDDAARHEYRERRGHHRAEGCDQHGDDAIGDELVGQYGPAKHNAGHEDVEEQIEDVGLIGTVLHDVLGKQRTPDRAQPHAAAALYPLQDEEQRCNGERRRQR